jgi:AraC-like DNA-binding protein/ligand-binding sensor protein
MDRDHAHKMGLELTKSAIFRDFENAFHKLTNLPLHYIPMGSDEAVDGITEHDNPLCSHFQGDSSVCGTCAMMHERLREQGHSESYTAQCFAGLTESVVPVKLGEEVIGFLQTGQVLMQEPNEDEMNEIVDNLKGHGVTLSVADIREMYFENHVMSKDQYDAVIRMLEIFAGHLSTIVNQLALDKTDQEKEPERVAMARTFIAKHLDENITLPRVAEAVNTSSFYFSRMFKQVTGHTFTEYLAMARIERAKKLMRDNNKNITQIAYESGFQSLSQFNRVFRKIQNEAPGTFRKRIHNLLGN